jgi:hypothetical protein
MPSVPGELYGAVFTQRCMLILLDGLLWSVLQRNVHRSCVRYESGRRYELQLLQWILSVLQIKFLWRWQCALSSVSSELRSTAVHSGWAMLCVHEQFQRISMRMQHTTWYVRDHGHIANGDNADVKNNNPNCFTDNHVDWKLDDDDNNNN